MVLGSSGVEEAVGETVGEAAADRLAVAEASVKHQQVSHSSWACQSQCLGLACPYTPACLIWLTLMHL